MKAEELENILLEALDEGAEPPREFTLRLPFEDWAELKAERGDEPIRIAGLIVHVVPCGELDGPAIWAQ